MKINSAALKMVLGVFGVLVTAAFALGLVYGARAHADDAPAKAPKSRMVYPKKTDLDFDGMAIEGEVKNPGEFYFQHRGEEKFDSLVQRRKNFHREMLRDAVLSK
jgi:hypothetical protein